MKGKIKNNRNIYRRCKDYIGFNHISAKPMKYSRKKYQNVISLMGIIK
jgi:hypothetical protein